MTSRAWASWPFARRNLGDSRNRKTTKRRMKMKRVMVASVTMVYRLKSAMLKEGRLTIPYLQIGYSMESRRIYTKEDQVHMNGWE
jgi:hypothetical protein